MTNRVNKTLISRGTMLTPTGYPRLVLWHSYVIGSHFSKYPLTAVSSPFQSVDVPLAVLTGYGKGVILVDSDISFSRLPRLNAFPDDTFVQFLPPEWFCSSLRLPTTLQPKTTFLRLMHARRGVSLYETLLRSAGSNDVNIVLRE